MFYYKYHNYDYFCLLILKVVEMNKIYYMNLNYYFRLLNLLRNYLMNLWCQKLNSNNVNQAKLLGYL